VEAVLGGEIEHVDAAQLAIGRVANRVLDGGNAVRLGRLPQHAEKRFGFTHRFPVLMAQRPGAAGREVSGPPPSRRRAVTARGGALPAIGCLVGRSRPSAASRATGHRCWWRSNNREPLTYL